MPGGGDGDWGGVLRRALDAVDTGVVVLSADLQTLLVANAAARRMIGPALTGALRRTLARVVESRAPDETRSAPRLVIVRRVPRWISVQRVAEPIPIEVALIESAEGETTLADLDVVAVLADAARDDVEVE